MSQQRKAADARENDLRLAMLRIEHGRAHTKASKLSISAVAREAGVSAALIHNHYPSIAEAIRLKLGASSRQSRDAARNELKEEREKNAGLRAQITALAGQVAKLASINEVLLVENMTLKATTASGSNVIAMAPRLPENR